MDDEKVIETLRQRPFRTRKVVPAKALHRKNPPSRRMVKLPTANGLRPQPGTYSQKLRPLAPMPVGIVTQPELDMNISQPSLSNTKLQENASHGDFDLLHHFPLTQVSNTATPAQGDVYSTSGISEPLMPEMSEVEYTFPAALAPSGENHMSMYTAPNRPMHTIATEWNPSTFISSQGNISAALLPPQPESLPYQANRFLGTPQTNDNNSTHVQYCPDCSSLWRKLRDSIMGIIRLQEGTRAINGGINQTPESLTTELLGSFFQFGDHWQDSHVGRAGGFGAE